MFVCLNPSMKEATKCIFYIVCSLTANLRAWLSTVLNQHMSVPPSLLVFSSATRQNHPDLVIGISGTSTGDSYTMCAERTEYSMCR